MTGTPASGPRLRFFEDADALAEGAAAEFLRLAVSKTAPGVEFRVALSGGSTPRRLYDLLAGEPYASRMPWERIHLFWGDERTVPPDHADSNFGAAQAALLSRVPVPPGNIHRIQGELEPARAAEQYEAELRRVFRLEDGALPRFDLVFLGMGPDGHTASLFPGSEALAETHRLVVAPWIGKVGAHRVTLTCPVLNSSAFIMFLVAGADKAGVLREVLEGPGGRYPAQFIRPADGELHWYIDSAAGHQLRQRGGRA